MVKAFRSGAEVEKQIITGMIVSAKFLKRISKIYRAEFLQVEYAPAIARWCLEHFKEYGQAPAAHIQDIFKARRKELKEGQDVLAQTFLERISREHEAREAFNGGYLFVKAKDYFHKRALLNLSEKLESLAIDGKLAEAEGELKDFTTVVSDVTPWIDPMSDKFISQTFENREANQVLTLPGRLGKMIGPLERGWLVGWLGSMKKGKTFWLYECGFVAAMSKLNVALFSLEMNAVSNGMRIFRRMTALPDLPGEIVFPVFDCASNQDGSCTMAERRRYNDVPLYHDDDKKPAFSADMDYRACTWCRDNAREFKPHGPRASISPYIVQTWLKASTEEKTLGVEAVRRKRRQFVTQYGSRMRLRIYPAYSATIDDVENDLDMLEYSEGFVPDVVVIDYADILSPTDRRLVDRSALDSIWKGLKGLAEKRNCLVITASQTNRKAIEKLSIRETDAAEDIRKIAHVDAMFGINQTFEEKSARTLRVNEIAHRHRFFSGKEVLVLSQLELGLPYVDSEFIFTDN